MTTLSINREYLKTILKKHAGEKGIIKACKSLGESIGIDWMIVYNFTKHSLPNEENLIKILRALKSDLDLGVLFL